MLQLHYLEMEEMNYFQGTLGIIFLKKKTYIVQMEKLHWEHRKVMNDFCKIFKIKYERCLEKSTYFGLQWWGDKVSNRWISGINKNFKINIDKNLFFKRDIIFFEYIAVPEYPLRSAS